MSHLFIVQPSRLEPTRDLCTGSVKSIGSTIGALALECGNTIYIEIRISVYNVVCTYSYSVPRCTNYCAATCAATCATSHRLRCTNYCAATCAATCATSRRLRLLFAFAFTCATSRRLRLGLGLG